MGRFVRGVGCVGSTAFSGMAACVETWPDEAVWIAEGAAGECEEEEEEAVRKRW